MTDTRITNMLVGLIEDTVRGRLSWLSQEVPRILSAGSDDIFTFYATAVFRGARFAAFEYRYRYFTDEESFYWTAGCNIAVLDDEDRVLWDVGSDVPEVQELIVQIKRKLSGIDSLLNQFR